MLADYKLNHRSFTSWHIKISAIFSILTSSEQNAKDFYDIYAIKYWRWRRELTQDMFDLRTTCYISGLAFRIETKKGKAQRNTFFNTHLAPN